MNKAKLLLAAVLMLSAPACAQNDTDVIGKQNIRLTSPTMTPEALWAMGRISSYEASPDGKRIVFQVGYYSVKQNKSHHVLYMMNADGSNRQLLTHSAKNETDATWLDAETIAFLTGGEIWAMKADGTARRQLSKTDSQVEGFKFSPDRSRVIILKSIPFHEVIKENPEDLPKATGRLVTDLMYRHWDHYVESIQHPFVCSVGDGLAIANDGKDILEGEPFECPMEPFGGMEQLAWSPDSKTIAYTCRKKTGLAYSISTDSDIFLYDVLTRQTRNLCKPKGYKEPKIDPTKSMKYQAVNAPENLKNNPGYDQNPKFSPDGKYVAWLSMARNGYESDRQRLCVYNLSTGEKKYLTETFDSNVDDFCWSDNKDALIYFIGVWHATENLYAVNWKGELKQMFATVTPQSGSGTQAGNPWADFGAIQLMNNGKQLLMERHSFTAPADLYVVTPNFKRPQNTAITQITFENKHITDQMAIPSVEQRWVTTTDGKQMLVWVVLPPNFDKTKKYPTLLFCEGGPQSPVSQFWSYRWNFMIMASQGYVVVAPNRRGLPASGSNGSSKSQATGPASASRTISRPSTSLPATCPMSIKTAWEPWVHPSEASPSITSPVITRGASSASSPTTAPSTSKPCTPRPKKTGSPTGNTTMPTGTKTRRRTPVRPTRTRPTASLTNGTPPSSASTARKTTASMPPRHVGLQRRPHARHRSPAAHLPRREPLGAQAPERHSLAAHLLQLARPLAEEIKFPPEIETTS